MSLKIANNFFDATLRVFERLYPDKAKNLIIQFDPHVNKEESGYTLLADSPGESNFIFINANLDLISAVDALVEMLVDIIFLEDENKNEFAVKKAFNDLMKLSEEEALNASIAIFKESGLNHKDFTHIDDKGNIVDFDNDEE